MAYKAKDMYLPPVVQGNIRTSGSTLTLGVGEVAFVDISKGAKALADFIPLDASSKLAIRMGEPNDHVSRSEDNKAISTIPFRVKDVVNIYVTAPDRAGVLVDDFVIGYNGAAGSEIDLDTGENEVLDFTFSGPLMGMIGLPDSEYTLTVGLTAPLEGEKGVDWTMHEIVENAYLEAKNAKLPGNIPLSNYVDFILVNSENPTSLPGSTSTFYNLVLADDGFQSDLGKVQAQYPTLDVKRTRWESGKSTYSAISSTPPSAYQPKKDYLLKGCDSCPSGYSTLDQGFVYEIVIDSSSDLTSTLQSGVPGAEGGSAVRNKKDGGRSYYSVVTDDALTDGEITTVMGLNADVKSVSLIAVDVADLCEQTSSPSTVAWTAGDSCNYVTDTYSITLADDDCGASLLADLQAHYPDLTITETNTSVITLTGTSGTATVTSNSKTYVATFATDLETTAANFVTAHAADILSETGNVVTADGDTLIFVGPSTSVPTIAETTEDLDGTVSTDTGSLCQRTYLTTVNTDLVCAECSPEFRDIFESEAPAMYKGVGWTKAPKVYSPTAKMGIRVRGKRAQLGGNEFLRDNMPFFDGSVEISLAGGYPTYTNESYLFGTNDRFAVKIFSRKADAQLLGGNLRKYEEEAQIHFRGKSRYVGNNYGKIVSGQETRLEPFKQYIIYSITVAPLRHVSNFQQPQNGAFTYHFILPLGLHESFETVVNKLAIAAGLPIVQAVSNA